MSAEFRELRRQLMRKNFGEAARKTALLQQNLEERGLIPESLKNGDKMRPDEAVGQWLTRIMKDRKISQRHLAMLADVDHSSISRMSSGDRMPMFDFFSRVVVALHIAPETVFESIEIVANRKSSSSNHKIDNSSIEQAS